MVYFILVLSGDPFVKIGYTLDRFMDRRMSSMQTASPYELVLMGVIRSRTVGILPAQLEQEIHDDLKADRIRGEWFEITERTDKWLAMLEKPPRRKISRKENRQEFNDWYVKSMVERKFVR